MQRTQSNLTLVVDMGWLLMSRFSVIGDGFKQDNPEPIKNAATDDLIDLMARSISIICNKLPQIDGIVLACEGGTWRKTLPTPECLQDITYKGNRTKTSDWDWGAIYKATNVLIGRAQEIGVTVAQGINIEGDDWAWYWSRRLNAEGTNVLIWSSDCDLKQLVCKDAQTGAWTGWYNDKVGLVLCNDMKEDPIEDDIDFFMKPTYVSAVLEQLKSRILNITYINPDDIAIEKILRGDAGDNIKSIVRYHKNGREYKMTNADFKTILEDFDIHSVEDLINNSSQIGEKIEHFEKYEQSAKDIQEMIVYNTRLVWLDNTMMPMPILIDMNGIEYKPFDINEIRTNYKVLTPENQEVRDLFENDDLPF